MLTLVNYSFPKTSLACVRKSCVIQNLDLYFSLHNAPNRAINIDAFLDRITLDQVYARFEGKTLSEKNLFLRGNSRRLKAKELYMSYHEFVEAAVVSCLKKLVLHFV